MKFVEEELKKAKYLFEEFLDYSNPIIQTGLKKVKEYYFEKKENVLVFTAKNSSDLDVLYSKLSQLKEYGLNNIETLSKIYEDLHAESEINLSRLLIERRRESIVTNVPLVLGTLFTEIRKNIFDSLYSGKLPSMSVFSVFKELSALDNKSYWLLSATEYCFLSDHTGYDASKTDAIFYNKKWADWELLRKHESLHKIADAGLYPHEKEYIYNSFKMENPYAELFIEIFADGLSQYYYPGIFKDYKDVYSVAEEIFASAIDTHNIPRLLNNIDDVINTYSEYFNWETFPTRKVSREILEKVSNEIMRVTDEFVDVLYEWARDYTIKSLLEVNISKCEYYELLETFRDIVKH